MGGPDRHRRPGSRLAGKGSLDGATQTLPMLYSLPGSDFHDITSGTSTG